MGGKGDTLADVYFEAAKLGIDAGMLPTLVEKDEFIYNTTRFDVPE